MAAIQGCRDAQCCKNNTDTCFGRKCYPALSGHHRWQRRAKKRSGCVKSKANESDGEREG